MEKKRYGFAAIMALVILINIVLWSLYGIGIFNIFVLIAVIMVDTFTVVNIIGLVKRYDRLSLEVSKDPLTNIYNRQYFVDQLEKEIARARRNSEQMAMVIFDIDDFKQVNDNYGHYAGDQVLVGITQLVQRTIRQYDTFGRLGGEEFALILPEITEAKAVELCERIRYAVEQSRLNRKIPITISIGVCMMDENDDNHSMYQKSDDAMYVAKRSGKNQVVVHQF